jgi:hypothetical protein
MLFLRARLLCYSKRYSGDGRFYNLIKGAIDVWYFI